MTHAVDCVAQSAEFHMVCPPSVSLCCLSRGVGSRFEIGGGHMHDCCPCFCAPIVALETQFFQTCPTPGLAVLSPKAIWGDGENWQWAEYSATDWGMTKHDKPHKRCADPTGGWSNLWQKSGVAIWQVSSHAVAGILLLCTKIDMWQHLISVV